MQKCQATTKSGEPCRAAAGRGGLCFLHRNPARAKELGQRGGQKNRRPAGVNLRLPERATAGSLRDLITQAINLVLAGELNHRAAMAVANLIKVQSAIIRDVDLENRIAELERQSTNCTLQEQKLTSGQGREAGFERDRQAEGTICITESVTTPANGAAANATNSSEAAKAGAATDTENESAGHVSTKKVAETEPANVFEQSAREEAVDSDANDDELKDGARTEPVAISEEPSESESPEVN
jgi:hypothetical protein